MRVNRLALAALVASVGACDFQHAPTAVILDRETVVVHAVLATGSDTARVLLTRAGPPGPIPGAPAGEGAGFEPLPGADVRLAAGADTLSLTEAPAGDGGCWVDPPSSPSAPGRGGTEPTAQAGCYVAPVPGGVRAGTRYELLIRLPDGRTVHGEAVPPRPIEVLEPALPWTVTLDSLPAESLPYRLVADLRIRYRAPEEVAAVQFGLAGPVVAFVDGRADPDVTCAITALTGMDPVTGAGEAVLPIDSGGCTRVAADRRTSVRPDSIRARVFVTAYDAPSLRYRTAMLRNQVEADAAAEGVSGAMGLFAGAATAKSEITLVPDP